MLTRLMSRCGFLALLTFGRRWWWDKECNVWWSKNESTEANNSSTIHSEYSAIDRRVKEVSISKWSRVSTETRTNDIRKSWRAYQYHGNVNESRDRCFLTAWIYKAPYWFIDGHTTRGIDIQGKHLFWTCLLFVQREAAIKLCSVVKALITPHADACLPKKSWVLEWSMHRIMARDTTSGDGSRTTRRVLWVCLRVTQRRGSSRRQCVQDPGEQWSSCPAFRYELRGQ